MAYGDRTFRTTVALSLADGGEHELDLVLTYRFAPGYPDTRDEPGQPDSAEIVGARIVPPGGVEVEVPAWLPPLIERDEACSPPSSRTPAPTMPASAMTPPTGAGRRIASPPPEIRQPPAAP